MTSEEFTKFVIGALFHDIGKFKQRAQYPEDKGKTHSTIGYEWLACHYGEGLIAAAARNHHGNEPETWETNLSLIIYEADNLAASERKEYDPRLDIEQTWQREVLLACEFCRIRMNETGNRTLPKATYWPLKPIGDWIEPQEKGGAEGRESYKILWERFLKDFEAMKDKETHLCVNHLLLLLEKYTSFVPSITLQIQSATDEETFHKHPDVSLFDHLRITAAAATCFYKYIQSTYSYRWEKEVLKQEIISDWENLEHKPFLLIGGDLSGVQRFIYTLSSKGALKSLKGRSFFLELFTEYVVDRILEAVQMSRCNVVFTGGGHFFLLGLNTEPCIQSMKQVRKEINSYLFKAFNGELFQCLEWVPMGKMDFKDATSLWTDLSEKLNHAKKRKWEDQLDYLLAPPSMPAEDCLTQNCEVCGREDQALTPGEVRMCLSCREQFDFGAKLQRLCRDQGESGNTEVCIAIWDSIPSRSEGILSVGSQGHQRFYQAISLKEEAIQGGHLVARYRINDWGPERYEKEDRPLLAGVYHDPDFEELEAFVQEGFGINRAAVLRMDVDHLGRIFSVGLSEGDRSFSRKSSLSRQLSLFFKYHVNGVLDLRRKEGYENLPRTDSAGRREKIPRIGRAITLVYSGGDDIFLIGQWLDCLELAFDINESFHRFTGNPEITLSGGFALGDAHHPVYRFADDSGDALTRAKAGGGDALDFFSQTFKWPEAKEVINLIRKEILPLLTTGPSCLEVPAGSFAKGFLYKLLVLARNHKKENIWILPKAAYLAGRN